MNVTVDFTFNSIYNNFVELLNKYKEQINKDLYIDDFNIKEAQLKLASKKHFWVSRLIDSKIELNKLNSQKKKLKKSLSIKIVEEAPVKLSPQSVELAVEASDDIQSLNEKIKEYEFLVEYLEKVEKIMQSMQWEIKNIIDINKLEQL